MTPAEIGSVAEEAAIGAVWKQWGVIGAAVSKTEERLSTTIVDPEALLLMTLAVRGRERRLDDVLAWFAGAGMSLISVKRFNALAKLYPEGGSEAAIALASLAVEAGDHRWERRARGGNETIVDRGKNMGKLVLSEPVAVMLRMRAAFGVGVKPDAITFLLGIRGRPVTVKDIAKATAYTPQAVRNAVADLSKAGILFHTTDRPVAYLMNPKPWDDMFATAGGEDCLPVGWNYIGHVFAMLSNVIDWAQTETEKQSSAYMASSRARDIYDGSIDELRLIGIDVPDASRYPGEEFLTAFGMTVRRVAEWLN